MVSFLPASGFKLAVYTRLTQTAEMALGQHCILFCFIQILNAESRKHGGKDWSHGGGLLHSSAFSPFRSVHPYSLSLSLSAFSQSPFHLSFHKNLTFLYDSFFLAFSPAGCVEDCLPPQGNKASFQVQCVEVAPGVTAQIQKSVRYLET